MSRSKQNISDDPLWYKDAVVYELHIRAFFDSDGDGIGDLTGLVQKLDYLADLGVNAIWILPFYPSPLKDDGYDIADYYNINSNYGNLKTFREFLKEAHKRGIRVITELVINHTSDQHEWFQLSRRAKPGSYWRDFYVWSDNPNKYREARIIFKDFETSNWAWDPVAKSYYWHRFYHHQPDLNFDNPEVQKAIFKVLDYWLEMGVDGMRLDAIPYLYEREGTSCENLPETHAFLKKLRAHVDRKFPNRMLLAEANQWPEEAVTYFGEADECHMCFHFPLMPRLFMALKMEDRYSITDILRQTPDISERSQWATFLRNHDELTLEMVTDEERDYMHKVYASDPRARINLGIRRRLAPLVGNDRRQIELLNGLLFSLPGTPVIYYGDEIGMGDNIYLGDRDGVRTPFQWSTDRNAGFSRANPQSLYLPVINSAEYHYEAVNVETQQNNSHSMLWWMKKIIALRKAYPEFGRGSLEFLNSENFKVLAFTREHNGRTLLSVSNLSRTVQYVELNLSKYHGRVPLELFGDIDFPPIGNLPYLLTLGPYAFYWFELVEKQSLETGQWLVRQSPILEVPFEPLQALDVPEVWSRLEKGIRSYLPRMRWFAGKSRKIASLAIEDILHVKQYQRKDYSAVLILRVNYKEGEPEHYLLALAYAEGERAESIRRERPDLVIAQYVRSGQQQDQGGIYYDAIVEAGFSQSLLESLLKRRHLSGRDGVIQSDIVAKVKKEWLRELPPPTLKSLEQSNSSMLFGQNFYFKIYRKLDEGVSPEIEIGKYFTNKESFTRVAPLVGALNYSKGKKTFSLAIAQAYQASETDGWSLILDQVAQVAEQALATNQKTEEGHLGQSPWQHLTGSSALRYLELKNVEAPQELRDVGHYTLSLANLLGKRTGEMHVALATEDQDPAFVPEPFTPFYQRSLFQSLRNLTDRTLQHLHKAQSSLDRDAADLADKVLKAEQQILKKFNVIKGAAVEALRTRVHGDYHLAQVLFTGQDFVIVDFEGEPARSISERRLKRSPLKDVAGMLRSFDYAAEYYLKMKVLREEDRVQLRNILGIWSQWMCVEFLKGYFEGLGKAQLLPGNPSELQSLLDVYILEKVLYEIGYELNNRPTWVDIPLRGILSLLNLQTVDSGS